MEVRKFKGGRKREECIEGLSLHIGSRAFAVGESWEMHFARCFSHGVNKYFFSHKNTFLLT